MSKYFSFVLTILILSSLGAGKDSQRVIVSSTIDAVTVFSDRAMVQRAVSHSFEQGTVTVEIPNLPANLIEESVRVSGKGTAKATILGVEVKKIFLKEAAQKRTKELEAAINRKKSEIKMVDDRLSVLNQKQKFVESISVKTPESISKEITIQRPSVNEWGQLLEFIDGSLVKIYEEMRQVNEQKQILKNELDVLTRKLRQQRQNRSKEEKSAVIDLIIDKPGSLDLDISYVILGANWTPLYDARVASETKEVDLIYQGVIRQHTGEDWNDVSLTLSTAKPSVAGRPPELTAWYLDQARPKRYTRTRPKDGRMLQFSAPRTMTKGTALLESADVAPFEIAVPPTTVSDQGITTTFSLHQKETILSNNEPRTVTITRETFQGERNYIAVPKLSEYAYLRTKITNQSKSPLLAGKVKVFFDGNFVTTSSNPLILPTESFDLYLGVDEGIKVIREMVNKFTDESGVMTKTTRKTYEYKIIVENYRKSEEKIVIKDQIPVSQHEDIKIELLNVTPETQEAKEDEGKGVLRWVLDLKPGDKREIRYKYKIAYPTGLAITGIE